MPPKPTVLSALAQARAQLFGLPGSGESFPFGPGAAVFKVGGKVFAIVDDVGQRISLKGDPDDNVALRQMYPGVIPGYHLNKKHWNTVTVADVPLDEVAAMIDASYDLVVSSLSKAARASLPSAVGRP
jgi:predicted DNA-binding protein (MmcQ/YjbR family)